MGLIVKRDIPLTIREESGEVLFRISDESTDSHRTVFVQKSGDFSQYEVNPIVTYGHPDISDPDPDAVIGTGRIIQKEGVTYSTLEFDPDPENIRARKVERKIKNKILRMASIRAYVEDARRGEKERGEDPEVIYFTRWSLLDWGVVMHASNKNATVQDISRSFNLDQPVEPIVIDEETKLRIKKVLKQ